MTFYPRFKNYNNFWLVKTQGIKNPYSRMLLGTASFSIRFRNGTCIIILDKKYNIANSSCHFGLYGSIWTGPSPKKYYMDLRSFGPYNIFLVTDRSIYCHMTLSAMNYWKVEEHHMLITLNSVVHRGFERRSRQTKDYEISISCFSTHTQDSLRGGNSSFKGL
jgi:hypothetical protein